MLTVWIAPEMEVMCLKSNVPFCCDPEMFGIQGAWPQIVRVVAITLRPPKREL